MPLKSLKSTANVYWSGIGELLAFFEIYWYAIGMGNALERPIFMP